MEQKNHREENKEILPWLHIGKYSSVLPIIQWWMGVGISTPELAWEVARNGGIGTLSSVCLCETSPYKHIYIDMIKKAKAENTWAISSEQASQIFIDANCIAIQQEIKKTKQIANGTWPIFINVMRAVNGYTEQILASCEAGVDWIVCGAGLPLNLPDITKAYPDVALIPIVSNLRAAKLITENRKKKYNKLPDAIIVEDPSTAGGHLWVGGLEDLNNKKSESEFILENSIPQIQHYIKEQWYTIPVIAAGGIVDNADVMNMLKLGADWVQVGTRFLASEESGAHELFKQAVVDSTEASIKKYMSNAGLPASALSASEIFATMEWIVAEKKDCIKNCLVRCWFRDANPVLAQMCILNELKKSTKRWNGKWLWFVGESAARITSILTVEEIMKTLSK